MSKQKEYDTVVATCPQCSNPININTYTNLKEKGTAMYHESSVPVKAAISIDGKVVQCSNCKIMFYIDGQVHNRVAIHLHDIHEEVEWD